MIKLPTRSNYTSTVTDAKLSSRCQNGVCYNPLWFPGISHGETLKVLLKAAQTTFLPYNDLFHQNQRKNL